jgi:lipopolysaccharide/colanic/teichoic acid biosynthesis glycosyltransferase
MLHFTDSGIAFKIAPPESISVIGSNAIDGSGELYVLHFNTLSRILNRRKKRLFDILLSFVFIAITPVWLLLVKKPAGMIRNIVYVLSGLSSWVGYYRSTGGDHPGLPEIKPGILTPYDLLKGTAITTPDDEQVNLSYAKDYRVVHDLQIILRGFTNLGRNPAIPINTNSGIDKKTTWPDMK